MDSLETVVIELKKAAAEGKETTRVFHVDEDTVMALDGMGIRTVSLGDTLICYTTGVIV